MGLSDHYEYVGEMYTQGSSKLELVSFCAPAKHIFRWGGVPTKSERFHGGFQRALTKRYQGITRFFNTGESSPTSIVVAFRESILQTTPIGYPASWPSAAQLAYTPQMVHISFDCPKYDPDTHDLSELTQLVATALAPRLELANEEDLDEESTDDEPDLTEDDEDDEDEERDADTTVDSEIDVGRSKLRAFHKFISDSDRVKEWLAEETKRYKQQERVKKRGRKKMQFSPESRLRYLLISLLRPAMIVDGQHRVNGAYESEKDPIIFNVCAIKDADWVEQVFQFVVLNKLAKPISPGFLTAILNTSLTNSEVQTIETRFDVIGMKNTDRIIMKYLNHDSRSPFANMISQPGEVVGVSNKGKLSDRGMLRLAKRWRSIASASPRTGNATSAQQEMKMFQPALGAKSLAQARKAWTDWETWTSYFYAFWYAIRELYAKAGIWEKRDKFHLLYIVTMHALQDLFLESKAGGDAKFKDIQDFSNQVHDFFGEVPPTFFQNWESTGLQSGQGPDWIKKAMRELRGGKKLGDIHSESPLFQKATP